MTQWTILEASNIETKRQVTTLDEIVLKSVFGIDEEDTVKAIFKDPSSSCSWKIHNSNHPFTPDWATAVHLKMPMPDNSRPIKYYDEKELNKFDIFKVQEAILIEDLLFVMTGFDGVYVKRQYEKSSHRLTNNFVIEHFEKTSLRQMCFKILKICEFHDKMKNYISQHTLLSCGTILHAFCAGLKIIEREYFMMVNQLDQEFQNGELNLQKIWFFIQPSLKIMDAVNAIISECMKVKAKGSALLSVLHKFCTLSSDSEISQIFNFLTLKTMVPFSDFLQKWIYKGVIEDVFEEFFVKKSSAHADFHEAKTWEKLFFLRKEMIPSFFEEIAHMTLSTGKFLNVIRECGIPIDSPHSQDLAKNFSNLAITFDFTSICQKTYEWANQEIISFFLLKEKLFSKFESTKKFFFMEYGDFFLYFIESAEVELSKTLRNVSIEKIESLLELAIRTSSSNNDPNKDDFTCEFSKFSLTEQLIAFQSSISNGMEIENSLQNAELSRIVAPSSKYQGIELFTLKFNCKWPMNLIFSPVTLTKYQMIFKHLFLCKFVERQVGIAWLSNQTNKKLGMPQESMKSNLLLQQMLHFSKNLVYNLCYEVIEDNWSKFYSDVKKCKNFSEIIHLHENMLDNCLRQSLLLNQSVLKKINSLNLACLQFSKITQSFNMNMAIPWTEDNFEYETNKKKKMTLEDRRNKVKENKMRNKMVIDFQEQNRNIEKFANNFDNHLKELMNILNEENNLNNSNLINLLTRIDYNGYYYNKFNSAHSFFVSRI